MNSTIDLDEVYKRFQPKILHYLTRLLGPNEAEDSVQEVFEKVNRGLDGFNRQSKLSTWIYRIATNTALDKLRSSSFKYSSQQTLLEETAGTKEKNGWTGQTESPVDPPDYSTVLMLSEIEGFKNKEIAEILQISLENVKVRLHRARVNLKKELNDGCDFYYNEDGTFACDRKPLSILPKKPD
jgi:RNA polymerase sigma-70 factor (ECF subfamily)